METINLLNEKEIIVFELQNVLMEGMKTQSLVYTQGIRGIGKTFNLIKFARKYNFWVVVRSNSQATILREKYDYLNIFGQDDKNLRMMQIVVVDECVDVDKLLKDMECKIITGFTNKSTKVEEKVEPFTDKILKGLQNDAESLSNKLSKNENNSDYKMMINNLKTTMELIQELEGKKDPSTINISNVTVNEVTNAEEFISQMKQISRNFQDNN